MAKGILQSVAITVLKDHSYQFNSFRLTWEGNNPSFQLFWLLSLLSSLQLLPSFPKPHIDCANLLQLAQPDWEIHVKYYRPL